MESKKFEESLENIKHFIVGFRGQERCLLQTLVSDTESLIKEFKTIIEKQWIQIEIYKNKIEMLEKTRNPIKKIYTREISKCIECPNYCDKGEFCHHPKWKELKHAPHVVSSYLYPSDCPLESV